MTDRAFVLLKSGRRLDLLDPDPFGWTDEDLATGLARTYRWGGHSRWELPLSVAQHSITVLHIRQALAERRLTAAEQLRELAHDMDEGLLGFDAITPLEAASRRRVSAGCAAPAEGDRHPIRFAAMGPMQLCSAQEGRSSRRGQ